MGFVWNYMQIQPIRKCIHCYNFPTFVAFVSCVNKRVGPVDIRKQRIALEKFPYLTHIWRFFAETIYFSRSFIL